MTVLRGDQPARPHAALPRIIMTTVVLTGLVDRHQVFKLVRRSCLARLALHIIAEGSRMPGSHAVRRPTDHALLVQAVRKPVIASAATR